MLGLPLQPGDLVSAEGAPEGVGGGVRRDTFDFGRGDNPKRLTARPGPQTLEVRRFRQTTEQKPLHAFDADSSNYVELLGGFDAFNDRLRTTQTRSRSRDPPEPPLCSRAMSYIAAPATTPTSTGQPFTRFGVADATSRLCGSSSSRCSAGRR